MKQYGYLIRDGMRYNYPKRESISGTDHSVMGFDLSMTIL